MTDSTGFRWLHFSDIHVGASGLEDMWPRFKTLLLDDLENLQNRTGPIDLVVFSGDLVQFGAASEFEAFDEILRDILDHIDQFQDRPQVLTVPGNHDLQRPKSSSAEAIALSQYWKNDALRGEFWAEGSQYRTFIGQCFEQFMVWRSNAISEGLHLEPEKIGLLPGDASYIFKKKDTQVGIAALNSTWLQLGGGDYEGELHVDAKQLLAITDRDPDAWASKNDINLIVTHQPPSWLNAGGSTTWENDVNPSGRFDLHLFGHMHEPTARTITIGGSSPRRELQAASLFGLQTFGGGEIDRIQGYSNNEISSQATSKKFQCWPRRLTKVSDGSLKLKPDFTLDLDEYTNSFSFDYQDSKKPRPLALVADPNVKAEEQAVSLNVDSKFDMDLLRQQSPESTSAHKRIRALERSTCIEFLKSDRVLWVASDWGMGLDGFLSSIIEDVDATIKDIYYVNLSDFSSREAFLESFKIQFGTTFPDMCEALSDAGKCILVLNDIEVTLQSPIEGSVLLDVEDIAQTIRDYAPEAFVVLRCRKPPKSVTFRIITLKPLDEPDLAIYVKESELGSETYSKPANASILFRHTDGVPGRIDSALRDLEYMSIGELVAVDPDYSDSQVVGGSVPSGLVAAVSDLQGAEDRNTGRAFQLLLALSALPRGEQLATLKRFLGPHPFGPVHARILHERSLIDTSTLVQLDGIQEASTFKTLSVPRPVREYIREITDAEKAKQIDVGALNLFFGNDWKSGNIEKSQIARRVALAVCGDHEIVNANTLIYRALNRALELDEDEEIRAATALASAFIGKLIDGDHFRSASRLCEDILSLLGKGSDLVSEVNFLKYAHARSLRMTGQHIDAKVLFEDLDYDLLNRPQKQLAKLSYALCLDSMDETADAIQAAKDVIKISKHTNQALHAEVIIAEQTVDEEKKLLQLNRLLRKAEKKKSSVIASNIQLTIADLARKNGNDSVSLLRKALEQSILKGDHYTAARSVVDLATHTAQISDLNDMERARLVEAYHYLYNERLFTLFDRCHAALWRVFDDKGETTNLLNLFRHSSFIWRLNGRQEREKKYLQMLLDKTQMIAKVITGRDGVYFTVRVGVVLGGTVSR
ncbi:metallophosphoesterase [Sulfitobacter sp. BSw21498]|uniref:metallophosphoesterase n=1 Tax=Sulfitobacter sp. BSw21498 TaxID=664426 RepID=UPI0014873AC3|nr:metallophosphoesterase [Sulfitobacter sp. BSw21498]